jgi:putative two-component system response regulator
MVQASSDQRAAKIMIVEDDPRSVKLMEAYLLPEGYEITRASDGFEALNKIEQEPVDVILLDVMMPNVNGYDVCKQLKADRNLRFIPIIMMTALTGKEDKIKGIEAGADEFVTKPVDREELLARIKSLLKVKALNEQLEDAENVLYVLNNILDAKDHYTQGHSQRVTNLALKLAKELRLSGPDQEILKKAGLVHDIGKIGVSEAILNKPSTLTPEEFEEIKKHSTWSEKICSPLKSMKNILPIIRHHHERIDGAGYPDGLKGDNIPLGARILAIADAYDAMSSDRPYRKGMPKEKAIQILKECAGTQWDAKLVTLFINML